MPESSLLRMAITPDLGTLGPLVYAHTHNRKNMYFDIVFLDFFGDISAQKFL
jgi:hypothetical protein